MEEKKDMLFGDAKIPPKKLIKRLWKYIRPVIWPLVFSFVLLIVNVIADIFLPLVITKFIENTTGIVLPSIYGFNGILLVLSLFQIIWGSGLLKIIFPHLSIFSPSPVAIHSYSFQFLLKLIKGTWFSLIADITLIIPPCLKSSVVAE